MIDAAKQAGFCQDQEDWQIERRIRSLAQAGLLHKAERQGQGGAILKHPVEDLQRWLVILGLERWLKTSRHHKLLNWIGSVDNPEVPDRELPLLSYILGIPGVSEEDARRAGLELIDRILLAVGDSWSSRDTAIQQGHYPWWKQGFLSMMLQSEYQNPDIYTIPDDRESTGNSQTLIEEIAGSFPFLSVSKPSKDDPDFFALIARIGSLDSVREVLSRAHPQLLQIAARWIRQQSPSFYQEGFFPGFGEPPYAVALAGTWAIFISVLDQVRTLQESRRDDSNLMTLIALLEIITTPSLAQWIHRWFQRRTAIPERERERSNQELKAHGEWRQQQPLMMTILQEVFQIDSREKEERIPSP